MMELRAHAKINLHLRSRQRRADGYHDLATVFCHLDLSEPVWLTLQPREIILESTTGLAVDEDLAGRAALELRRVLGNPSLGCAISIEKRIPEGGGLGGGSADAAAVLRGLQQLWKAPWPLIHQVAVGLGADVPFLLHGGLADARGIGEQLTPLSTPCPPLDCLLLFPGVPVSTPQAYGWLDADGLDADEGGAAQHEALIKALRAGDTQAVVASLYNAFDDPVRRRVDAVDRAMHEAAAVAGKVMLCGSGSTLAVFDATDKAQHALARWNPTPARLSGMAKPIR